METVNVVCFYKKCCLVIKPEQPKMICWLCDRMVHTKSAGFDGRTSDDLAKGKNLNYCCDACLVVANMMKSFMRQTKGGLKELINSFGVARDSFRNQGQMINRTLQLISCQSQQIRKFCSNWQVKKIRSNPINPLWREPTMALLKIPNCLHCFLNQ